MLRRKTEPMMEKHCASLRNQNSYGRVTRGILHVKFTGKCQRLIPGQAFCRSLRSRNAHGHVTRGSLCSKLQGKGRTHISRDHHFFASLRGHDARWYMSQEALCAKIIENLQGKCGTFRYISIERRAFCKKAALSPHCLAKTGSTDNSTLQPRVWWWHVTKKQ